ncbi:hypothetical protein ABQ455_22375 [Citrobacter freundii]|uniref:hypothetical protein n=1 Tax=Citrobacter freundii TaxID=546 RepID=UPI00292C5AB7|nr:hypothetical protein [Citrobacter freundii]MDV0832908.1 hypothetical protein [Citrobacter freundii]MDV0868757.1 hypothetical protein [Citrobacter freundii]MDV1667933.1 hypothetical protein [Citrobacter freundii]MDV1706240.1 hypothetical protein [Citrobacter freundii]MDV1740791.1 hypothetical protein [Citrobacter freundii]
MAQLSSENQLRLGGATVMVCMFSSVHRLLPDGGAGALSGLQNIVDPVSEAPPGTRVTAPLW